MPRYIDADKIEYESIDSSDTNRYAYYYGTGIFAVRKEDIDAMPTADVVEVVRCKDCKHADKFYHCTYMNKWNTADGFCYCGERADI